MTFSGKGKSKSISLPEDLWPLVDEQARAQHSDRSEWVRRLIIDALEKAGVLDGGERERLRLSFEEALERHGPEKMAELLEGFEEGELLTA